MMYRDKLVASVKVGKKILRERERCGDGATVYVPFGTEYSLLFKNLHSRRAAVSVEIDGVNVLGGSRLVIGSNVEYNLERFIENHNLSKGNRFKFIQKTEQISDYRGDRVDDGVIRICWQYEQVYQPFNYGGTLRNYFYTNNNNNILVGNSISGSSGLVGGCGGNGSNSGGSSTVYSARGGNNIADSCNSVLTCGNLLKQNNVNTDDGITVKGSVSDQHFSTTSLGYLENEVHVITLMLRGTTEKLEQLIEPLTVQRKLKCTTCGQVSKSHFKYCPNCSTALSISI